MKYHTGRTTIGLMSSLAAIIELARNIPHPGEIGMCRENTPCASFYAHGAFANLSNLTRHAFCRVLDEINQSRPPPAQGQLLVRFCKHCFPHPPRSGLQ
jgi:hypothetical protein